MWGTEEIEETELDFDELKVSSTNEEKRSPRKKLTKAVRVLESELTFCVDCGTVVVKMETCAKCGMPLHGGCGFLINNQIFSSNKVCSQCNMGEKRYRSHLFDETTSKLTNRMLDRIIKTEKLSGESKTPKLYSKKFNKFLWNVEKIKREEDDDGNVKYFGYNSHGEVDSLPRKLVEDIIFYFFRRN
jgi:hypothetical protein